MGFVSANQVTIGYTAASREDAIHLTAEGHARLADALCERIRAMNL